MICFAAASIFFSAMMLGLTWFDHEERTDMDCDCMPYELVDCGRRRVHRKTQIEYYRLDECGEMIRVEQKTAI